MPKAFQLSILLLTEDSGKQGYDTLHALTVEMLRLVDAQARLTKENLDFEPLQNEQARLALRANTWKSSESRDEPRRVELVRTIAGKLMEPNGFVFFHFDGDRRWKKRRDSENTVKFEKLIKSRVELLLRMQLDKLGVRGRELEERLTGRMQRFCPLTPFYSIESWLFQNTETAKRICREKHNGRDLERFEEWEAARQLLDEVEKPKEEVCLRDGHNLELAVGSFPTQPVFEVGKSFTAAIELLKSCQPLVQALGSTHSNG
ncbi:hypothetical protein [Archangium sp.]|uniref:hypothetical protein n=1 Tax=Archangium sp. TaxID=1872627 RepID=UPI002D72AB62|nr:hypothetical protein [Archangium sp.]HYO60163.1 hypothetical protein [Archangium sp.]